MSKFIELAAKINKKNGQISTYFPKKKLPKKILDEIEKQPSAAKKFLIELKGVKYG